MVVCRAHLAAGTDQTVLSAHVVLAVLAVDEYTSTDKQNLFQKLSLLRSIAQKVKESVGNDKPFITRPSREARDLLKELDDGNLDGLF